MSQQEIDDHNAAQRVTYATLSLEQKQQRSKKQREWRNKNLAVLLNNGLCSKSLKCQQPVTGQSKYCLSHWLKSLGGTNKAPGRTLRYQSLLEMWTKQRGCCAITGIRLIPGKTAVVDHVIPVGRGGTHDKTNLRFVHCLFNTMKMGRLDNELKEALLPLLPQLTTWCLS